MDQILTHDYSKFQKPDPNNTWKLPDQDSVLDQQLFTKISDFYASCMNQDAIETVGVEPLFEMFRTIQRLIPLSHDVSQDQLQEAIRYLADRGIWTLFKFDIIMDTKPTLYFSHAPIETYNDTPAYMDTMIATLDRIFKQDTRNEFGFKYWSTTATARRVLEFEERLLDSGKFHSEPLTSWTIDELQERLPYLDWHAYIQQHMGNLPAPSTVFIPDPEFIDNLGRDVMSTTNARTLQMYFLWRTMWKYVDMLGDEFQVPKRQLEALTKGMDPRAKPDRRDTCMQVLDQSAMGVVVGRYYIKDHEQDIKQAREKLQIFINDMMTLVKEKVTDSNIIKKVKSTQRVTRTDTKL
jgi:predicted metalloendopeptidase